MFQIVDFFFNSQERKEADDWKDNNVKGGKSKQEDKEEKRKADLARKAENARLLAEEEATVSSKPKPAPKKKGAKDTKPAGPGAIAAGGGLSPEPEVGGREEVESYAATGIDNALDLLEVVTAKMDKASVGQQAANIERHPEVSICIICLSEWDFNKIYSAALRYIISITAIHLMCLFLLRLHSKHICNVNSPTSRKRWYIQ